MATSAPRPLAAPGTSTPWWLPTSLVALIPVVLVRLGSGPMTDPDVLWHVLLGRAVLAGDPLGSAADPLSGRTTVEWVYHQWLPEIVAAWVDGRFGLWAVAWLAHVGRVAVVLAVWWVCRREAGPLAAAVATSMALAGTAMSLGPRPQLVGLALLPLVVGAWMDSARDGAPRWWLVPVTWFWACCHGTWSLSVLLGAAMVLAMAIQATLTGRTARAVLVRLGGVPVLSLAAACVTPVGPRLLLSQGHVAAISDFVSEWRRPSFTDVAVVVTGGVVAACLVSLLLAAARSRGRDLRPDEVVLLASSVAAVLLYQRTVAVAAVLVAPLMARLLERVLSARRSGDSAARDDLRTRRSHGGLVLAGAMASILMAWASLPATAAAPGNVPTALTSALSQLPRGTVVFNDETLGGWLLMTFPQVSPTLDTRLEAFGPVALQSHEGIVAADPGWSDALLATGARAVLVEQDTGLARLLTAGNAAAGSPALSGSNGPAWRLVGSDVGFALFVRP